MYRDESQTEVRPLEKHFVWMYPSKGSGLWFPPGRVLVCDDKLDLAIFMNESDVAAYFERRDEDSSTAIDRSQDDWFPDVPGASHVAVLEKAGRVLWGNVDR